MCANCNLIVSYIFFKSNFCLSGDHLLIFEFSVKYLYCISIQEFLDGA
jgi:hypothetical protein